MSGIGPDHISPYGDQRAALVARLRARRPELDEIIHAHVRNVVAEPRGDEDVEYEAGQYAAVADAVDYGLSGIEHGENWSGPVPATTIAQAHRAARHGVPLDAVIRRYHAGHAKLADIVMEEIEHSELSDLPAALRLILGLQASLLGCLTAEIATEYMREVRRSVRSPEQCRADRVQRLLSGASFDTFGLGYELDEAWHICVIAIGLRAEQAVRALAAGLDCQLLPLPRSKEILCAWLGGPRSIAIAEFENVPLGTEALDVRLAVGEPGRGIDGWRLTYRQAQAALRIALLEPPTLTRYADVALLAPWVPDHTLAQSFVDIYLSPLNELRDGGVVARETLQAYFEAGHQVAAAAHALGVDRGTLRKRLASIENRLGYAVRTRQAELEVALRLESLWGTARHWPAVARLWT